MAASSWKAIPCKISELSLDKTLVCGQSFRWRQDVAGDWVGVFANHVWKLKQTNTELLYQILGHGGTCGGQSEEQTGQYAINADIKTGVKRKKQTKEQKTSKKVHTIKVKEEIIEEPHGVYSDIISTHEDEAVKKKIGIYHPSDESEILLKDYFQLGVNLEKLYKEWSKADANFKSISEQFSGIRILRQDPMECLFAFICSSNNNITRISSMVEKLAVHYGKELCEVKGEKYFSFPSVTALSVEGVEERLRELGFGYRARYIQNTARFIQDQGGGSWLHGLRLMDYKNAKSQLLRLTGVGPKVADCVSLFCLDKSESIPVDTHVWQIAARDYIPKLRQAKSLTDKLYEEIGDHFRTLWGPYAGWAHSVLFTADLKQFKVKNEQMTSPEKSKKRSVIAKHQTEVKQNKKK